ncbi:NYN domain-containing protein [Segatella copri]|mgnify:FL=1|uniref:NYN domain-containing protein n=1 Tax=Segatella copri TaxID=165179 RepID=UPI002FEF62F5
METENKIAMLIDADNVSHRNIKEMTDELARFGNLTIKRIYGDFTKPSMNGWKDVLLENAINPIQQYNYTTGKNATDSSMIIDAMDILYSNQVDIFCLVSSDSDFTRLAMRLREAGKEVIGMGMKQTPKPFIAACNKFIYLEVLSFSLEPEQIKTISPEPASIVEGKSVPASGEGEKQQIENVPELTIKQETVPAFLSNIGEAVDSVANDSGWSQLGDVGNLLVKKDPAFDTRNYGFKKLSSLIEAYPSYFDLSKVNNSHLIVRENEIKEVGNSPPLIWRFSKNQNICLINLYFVSIPHCTCHFRP